MLYVVNDAIDLNDLLSNIADIQSKLEHARNRLRLTANMSLRFSIATGCLDNLAMALEGRAGFLDE